MELQPIIDENLFEKVLMEPAEVLQGEKDISLDIVSGYATDGMAKYHMKKLDDINILVSRIRVVVGIEYRLDTGEWLASDKTPFKEINITYEGIKCDLRFIQQYHAKVYVWLAGGTPEFAFLGSANYSKTAFDLGQERRIEAMIEADPDQAHRFFEKAWHKRDASEATCLKVGEAD